MATTKSKHVPRILQSQRDPATGRLMTLFTPERVHSILADLRKGLPRSVAASRARISDRAVQGWLDRGEEEQYEWEDAIERGIEEEPTQHALFYLAAKAATSDYWDSLLTDIKKRVDSGVRNAWTELATFHERMNAEFYGRKDTVNVNKDVKITYEIKTVDGSDWNPAIGYNRQAKLPPVQDDTIETEWKDTVDE